MSIASLPNVQRGFTLVEAIIVLVLVGVLAALATVFILPPFEAAVAMRQRADLVESADSALDQIVREARGALPNSIRVHQASGNAHVEFITTRTGGRYRRLPAPGGGGDLFVPARTSGSFDVMGALPDAGAVATRGPGTDCAARNGDCLSVFNTGQPGFDAYSRENLAAITAASAGSVSWDSGGIGPAFATHSPSQRFFVVADVVSYVCDLNAGELRRFSGYGLQPGTPSPGGAGELVAERVTSCSFSFDPGSATRRGLLTARLDLRRGAEAVFLVAQAQVGNAP
ncbi:MAG: type II secretion system protein [Wenzhouxiangellaceae bacterium]|nr:type II secretion system protein [Wenzhouxiangellaceae bacterium]